MIHPLTPLLGRWAGEGSADYPTIALTPYLETLSFVLDEAGQRLQYEQKTWVKATGALLHWEFGFLTVMEDSSLSLSNTQNNGRVEVLKGSLEGADSALTLRLESVSFGNDPRMVQAAREIRVEGDQLHYTQRMATQTVAALSAHLDAHLRREG